MNAAPQHADDGFLRPEEMRELRATLFDQGREALDALHAGVLALEGRPPGVDRLRQLKRHAHTLKGDCGSVGFAALAHLAHALEDALDALQPGTLIASGESDLLLLAIDTLRAGLEAGARDAPGPDVSAVAARLGRLSARSPGRGAAMPDAEGRMPLRVRVDFAAGTRRRAQRLDAFLRRIEAQVLARSPEGPPERSDHVDLVVHSTLDPDEVAQRAARLRTGLRASVEPYLIEPGAPGDAPGDPALPSLDAAAAREGETIRVEARRVDEVLDLVGEIVTARAALAAVAAEIEPRLTDDMSLRLTEAQSLLARVVQDLQRSAMRMRLVPAARVFRRFARVVRDLGRATGKRVSLRIEGEATELDRGLLDALEEPLLHLVRNAVDHGLEAPAERRAHGKPEEAVLSLRANREGNQVLIEVGDDGRGVDTGAVVAAAVASGALSAAEAEALGDEQRAQLVFRPGLSTARVLSETSGRGVGLDVVRATVEALRGSVRVLSRPGCGATFVIRVPLTVAILPSLLFRVGARTLAVPLASVLEIARVSDLRIDRAGGHAVFTLRQAALGLVELGELLGQPAAAAQGGCVLVLRNAGADFGVRVDEVLGEQELVIKAVHDRFIRTPLVAGAAVMGRGTVVLILDVPAVLRAALSRTNGDGRA